MTTVLYVMGAGRSGSTIFDVVLGNHPDISGFGELNRMVPQAWLRGEYCACGQVAETCAFWAELRRRWLGDSDVADQAALEAGIESLARWLGPAAAATRRSDEWEQYAERMRALFAHLADMTGSRVIVDSSKTPARALALSQVDGVDLRVVHLVRDPRGVVWSLRKKLAKDLAAGVPKDSRVHPVWYSAAAWSLTNAAASWIRRQLPRTLFLRYEDFVGAPVPTLEAVGELVGVDMAPLLGQVVGEMDLTDRHLVAGNRLRMNKTATLRVDEAWRDGLSPREQRLCGTIAAPLMRSYGYSRA